MRKICLALALASVSVGWAEAPKYVFLFIGDGMSTPQRMVAEEFAAKVGHGEFAMNRLPFQANTRTRSANAVITDSAAAATAIACGEKANNHTLGVSPDGSRLESVAEFAKKRGMKVGIMTTVGIVHATPAGFYAHRTNRGLNYQIALDLVDSGFDYFAGGGINGANNPKKDPAYRGDIWELARAAGYEICTNRAQWAALKPGSKSWSVFSKWQMGFQIDADGSLPTPAEMVAKGIEAMEGPDGFFLMCESGMVDHAGHANDAATNLREVLALDDAVKVALAFLDRHPAETLVVVTGDHETGGLSMGFSGVGEKFDVGLLAHQKTSVEKFSEDIKKLIKASDCKMSFDEAKPLLTEKFGLVFDKPGDPMQMSAETVTTLAEAFSNDVRKVRGKVADTTAHDVPRRYVFAQTVKNVLNAHAGVGWSSGCHTALPTLTTAKGNGAEILVGMSENTDIARRLKALLK